MKTFYDYESLCKALGEKTCDNRENHSKELKSRITWKKLDNGKFEITSYTPKFEFLSERIMQINHIDNTKEVTSEVVCFKGVGFNDFVKAGYELKDLF